MTATTITTIAALLATARTRIAPAEARLLLGHLLQRSTAWLEAHRDEPVDEAVDRQMSALVGRRSAGEPMAYLLGVREFYGRDFAVTADVLIPRPETELLVDIVKEKVGVGETAHILDLGTGSGCLAITLALECTNAQITAVDVSAPALAVARRNAQQLDARVCFVESNWFSALPAQAFDLIVANPPYVAAGDPHLSEGDLRFEPQGALTDHADGLAALRHIIAHTPTWLSPQGWLFCEHGYDQAGAVRNLLQAAGFTDIEQHHDLAGIVRCAGARITN
ncbi:MAG: peptide chain release factor N(5)-glutamine methyltransferase [Rhodocyclaceae bacterium]|nr:peptide chain release factor N(5)-glutamine methyltransferase [Rhodocyclaceae bacterium]MDZ4215726.1 peptide chain release factor N(5)-glutamine methyltransferase [Rhodocyclaceae bacterium]